LGSPTLPGGPEDPDRTHEPAPYRAPVWIYPPSPPQNAWQRWGRSATLFVVTLASVFLAGAIQLVEIPGYGAILGFSAGEGLALMVGLISVLLAHEMGHYLACRHYHVDATLPNFIPSPWIPALGLAVWQPLSFVGTFGAFIRIRSPIPHRRALFDIGIAGPLAGFVVCLPVLVLGVLDGHVVPHTPGGLEFGEPLLFQWASHAINGPIPPGEILAIGALGQAAWFGLFVTALNLMPIGQLDGGHATYSLLRERAHRISRVGSWICVALVYFGPNWILWAILIRVLGRRHPPTLNDGLPVGRGRKLVGLLSLVVFVVCFVPNPVIWSWTDFFEAVGLTHFVGLH
jgi:membrane-associated protease RseP (regulator of RpoE activity)